ncbi:M48 family metallopeptidase [Thalassotalea sp. M1531]|uniref:M48 family metallopeptidase n=1 Tax=Thalassotalea algicola TaxID=2716224 RepID=A0A7Y0LCP8_9GAMM|nr:SprT family zinc-dependent metalloprotease [Thalassotalea algicola]NMP32143.1 M48 family metallopeptidase [Thalassotalea algicola]
MKQVSSSQAEKPPYQLIRSNKRKTLGLQVKKGEVIVRAPFFVEENFIEQFIAQKAAWLNSKIAQQQVAVADAEKYRIADNGVVYFMGLPRRIKLVSGSKALVFINDCYLECVLSSRYLSARIEENQQARLNEKLSNLVDSFYKSHALKMLPSKLDYWQDKTGLSANELVIKKYKARWGSCNSKGVVSLNSWLVACPPSVIDYVIVHELCHLVHLNHSRQFWSLVESFYPQFQQAKMWLKENQYTIAN